MKVTPPLHCYNKWRVKKSDWKKLNEVNPIHLFYDKLLRLMKGWKETINCIFLFNQLFFSRTKNNQLYITIKDKEKETPWYPTAGHEEDLLDLRDFHSFCSFNGNISRTIVTVNKLVYANYFVGSDFIFLGKDGKVGSGVDMDQTNISRACARPENSNMN